MPPFVLRQPPQHFLEYRVGGTPSQHAISLKSGQLRNRSPSEIHRMEMPRKLAQKRSADPFKPLPERGIFLKVGRSRGRKFQPGRLEESPNCAPVENVHNV